jgi:hypothetical protein
MISIRLSDDDYSRMKAHCGDSASVSDFMRTAILQALDGNTPFADHGVELHIVNLRTRLDTVERKLEDVAAHVGLAAVTEAI